MLFPLFPSIFLGNQTCKSLNKIFCIYVDIQKLRKKSFKKPRYHIKPPCTKHSLYPKKRKKERKKVQRHYIRRKKSIKWNKINKQQHSFSEDWTNIRVKSDICIAVELTGKLVKDEESISLCSWLPSLSLGSTLGGCCFVVYKEGM